MNEFDLPSGVGFLIFQPVFGVILSGLTIIACLIIGLPIRLIPELYNWWSKRPLIIFVGVAIGLILLFFSLTSNFTETAKIVIDGEERTKQIPNTILAITGWFLTAFSLLHFYPLTIIKWFKEKIFSKQLGYKGKGFV